MPSNEEYDNDIVEINLSCQNCDIEYSVFTSIEGFLEQARYCPFCGTYNLDYDRTEE